MELRGDRNNILVLTICTGEQFEEVGKISHPIFLDYCRTFSYDFVSMTTPPDTGRPPVWNKIPAVAKEIRKYKHVFWVDSDCIIKRYVPLESLISKDFDLTIGKFPVAEGFHLYPFLLHTGAFLIANTQWSNWFLKMVYSRPQDIDSYSVDETSVTMVYRLIQKARDRINVVDHSRICSITSEGFDMYTPGCFIRHFARMSHDKRIAAMRKDIENSTGNCIQ